MATTPRPGLPTFWSTGIARALVGENACMLQPWLLSHFQIDKRPRPDSGALAKWKSDHTQQLQAERDRLQAEGWKLRVEQFFRLTGQSAILSGKPDLIAQQDGKRPKILDIKSGQPRDSDVSQVAIYCIAMPLAWSSPSMIFEGEVVYPTHRILVTAADVENIRPSIFALLRKLASDQRPSASPSESACRFCDVDVLDCPERWQDTTPPVLVSEF